MGRRARAARRSSWVHPGGPRLCWSGESPRERECGGRCRPMATARRASPPVLPWIRARAHPGPHSSGDRALPSGGRGGGSNPPGGTPSHIPCWCGERPVPSAGPASRASGDPHALSSPPAAGSTLADDHGARTHALMRSHRLDARSRGGEGGGRGEHTRRARDGFRVPPRGAGPNWGSGPEEEPTHGRARRPRRPVLEKSSARRTNPIRAGRRRRAPAWGNIPRGGVRTGGAIPIRSDPVRVPGRPRSVGLGSAHG